MEIGKFGDGRPELWWIGGGLGGPSDFSFSAILSFAFGCLL